MKTTPITHLAMVFFTFGSMNGMAGFCSAEGCAAGICGVNGGICGVDGCCGCSCGGGGVFLSCGDGINKSSIGFGRNGPGVSVADALVGVNALLLFMLLASFVLLLPLLLMLALLLSDTADGAELFIGGILFGGAPPMKPTITSVSAMVNSMAFHHKDAKMRCVLITTLIIWHGHRVDG